MEANPIVLIVPCIASVFLLRSWLGISESGTLFSWIHHSLPKITIYQNPKD